MLNIVNDLKVPKYSQFEVIPPERKVIDCE